MVGAENWKKSGVEKVDSLKEVMGPREG